MARGIPLSCVLLTMLWGAQARAEPFTILPNGRVVYNVALTTSGVFHCQGSQPCSGGETNSVTLGSGTKHATITFTGVTTTFLATNIVRPVALGTFDVVSTPGFTFPQRGHQSFSVLSFGLIFEHTSPNPAIGRVGWRFGPGGHSELPIQSGFSWAAVPLTVNPPHVGYTAFVYTVRPFPFRLPANGSVDIVANVGVVPEPGTMLLVGSGIVGLIGGRRRAARSRSHANRN